jgi:hypothetical protein
MTPPVGGALPTTPVVAVRGAPRLRSEGKVASLAAAVAIASVVVVALGCLAHFAVALVFAAGLFVAHGCRRSDWFAPAAQAYGIVGPMLALMLLSLPAHGVRRLASRRLPEAVAGHARVMVAGRLAWLATSLPVVSTTILELVAFDWCR